ARLERNDPVYLAAPRDEHRTALTGGRGPPDPVAVADLQCLGQARALDIARTAQRHRGVGRLAGRREERLRVDRLARAAGAPPAVVLPFPDRTQQSRVPPCSGYLMRTWHPRSGHAPPPPW